MDITYKNFKDVVLTKVVEWYNSGILVHVGPYDYKYINKEDIQVKQCIPTGWVYFAEVDIATEEVHVIVYCTYNVETKEFKINAFKQFDYICYRM